MIWRRQLVVWQRFFHMKTISWALRGAPALAFAYGIMEKFSQRQKAGTVCLTRLLSLRCADAENAGMPKAYFRGKPLQKESLAKRNRSILHCPIISIRANFLTNATEQERHGQWNSMMLFPMAWEFFSPIF